MQRSGTNGRAL